MRKNVRTLVRRLRMPLGSVNCRMSLLIKLICYRSFHHYYSQHHHHQSVVIRIYICILIERARCVMKAWNDSFLLLLSYSMCKCFFNVFASFSFFSRSSLHYFLRILCMLLLHALHTSSDFYQRLLSPSFFFFFFFFFAHRLSLASFPVVVVVVCIVLTD